MALSADTPRTYADNVDPVFLSLPCTSNVTIYEGSAVAESTTAGTVKALAASDTVFWGFAHQQVINPSSGTKRCTVRTKGIVRLPVTGASAVTDNGVAVYASDDGTFTLTSSSTFVQIGKVATWITSTTCDVYFEATVMRSI
jgi:hypothetical protein